MNLVKAEDWKNCYAAAAGKSISDIFDTEPYEIPGTTPATPAAD